MRRRNATDWWTCTKVVPQGVNEPSESNVDLTASQYDTHKDVVGPNEIIRIESYVFDKKRLNHMSWEMILIMKSYTWLLPTINIYKKTS